MSFHFNSSHYSVELHPRRRLYISLCILYLEVILGDSWMLDCQPDKYRSKAYFLGVHSYKCRMTERSDVQDPQDYQK